MADYSQTQSKEESQNQNDQIALFAKDLLDSCEKFKRNRYKDWKESEDLYLNKTRPALSGRFNVPLPMMSGFIDTMLAEIRERPAVEYEATKNSDPLRAKKVTAAWEIDSDSQHANWRKKNNDAKKIASIYGVCMFKVWSSSIPNYVHHLDLIDPYDMIFEPLAGNQTEKHGFLGQDNIFRSMYDLEGNDFYDQGQVSKLKTRIAAQDNSTSATKQTDKANRYAALGLDGTFRGFKGDQTVRCAEMGVTYKGERYYIFFVPEYGIWLRCAPLKEVYASNLWPFVAGHPYPDPFNFLSKAPADDFRPVAHAAQIIFNQILDNNHRRNLGMRGYDPDIVTDPSQLEWRPDGLVDMRGLAKGTNISNGIFQFSTPEITGSINLLNYMDNFVGQKTGVSASAQGATNTDAKVGVYFGDLKQVAKRMTLQSESFSEMMEQMAIRYSWCLWEHMPEDFAVKVLGEDGANWVKLNKDDAAPDFSVHISGGLLELQASELEAERRMTALAAIIGNPVLAPTLNPRWVAEQQLLAAGFKAEDIRRAQDLTADVGAENDRANASQAIEDILQGKQPQKYLSAGRPFLQKLLDFVTNNELKASVITAISTYFQQMSTVVAQNTARQAMADGLKAAREQLAPLGAPPVSAPAPTVAPTPPSNAMGEST